MQNSNLIELPVKEWQHAFQGLGKVVRRKSGLPVLQYLKIRRDPYGQVVLAGTDLDSFVCYRTKTPQAGPPTEFLVPMEAVERAVKSSENKVGLISEGPRQVEMQTHLAGQLIEQPIESVAKEDWPVPPQLDAAGFKVGGDFLVTLRQALECAAEEPARRVLQSVCLDTSEPGNHYVVASNGRLMFSANSFAFDLKAPLVIPTRKFLHWSELEGEVVLSVQSLPSEKETVVWLRFQIGPWDFITRAVAEPFPNWRAVVPAGGFKARVQLNTTNMKTMLEVTPKLPGSDDVDQPVILAIQEGCFQLASRPKNSGSVASIRLASAVVEGETVRAGLNRLHLLKALRFGLNEIKIVDELSPVLFSNTAGKRLVVAPVRLI